MKLPQPLTATAGLGVAALAIKDEDERWRTWYELPRRELAESLDMLGDDGAWHEGVSGWCYAMAALMPFVEASRNVAGEDFYRFAWLKETGRTRLRLRLPSGGYFNSGDSYRDGGYGGMGSSPVHTLRLVDARSVPASCSLARSLRQQLLNFAHDFQSPPLRPNRPPIRNRPRPATAIRPEGRESREHSPRPRARPRG